MRNADAGYERDMGGIVILLLVIALAVIVAIAVALYGTGGFLWWKKTDPSGDSLEETDDLGTRPRSDGGEAAGDERRPQHTAPTTPAKENTDFAGTPDAERRR
jgi:hypothetical protein